jgi:acyl carrier protein
VNSISENRLVDLVVEWVKKNREENGLAPLEVTADTDLIANGLLDSFGFVDLIMYVEAQDGCKVDLADADPADFAIVKGLCRIALKQSPVSS